MTQDRALLGGTDGFRGRATDASGPGLVNEETIAGATHALVGYQLSKGVSGPVVIAQDTRPSGDRLRRAAIDGALTQGVEVWDLGTVPTPLAQKVAQDHAALATVVITASHNPAADNGWKGMPGSRKPSQTEVRSISEAYWSDVDKGFTVPRGLTGNVHTRPDLVTWYEDTLVADIQKQFGNAPLRGCLVVVDGAYGATQQITPKMLERLGATVETFSCDATGIINDGCGAADLTGLKQFLLHRPDILKHPHFIGAVANDGDGDRMMGLGVLPGGRLVEIDGNHVMWALAQGQHGIVGTIYTNSGLTKKLQASGIGFEYCANGDVFVTEKLRELQAAGKTWTRGGEFSGHHVMTDWLASGDGVRMAAWFASWVATQDKTFADIYHEVPLWSQQMVSVAFPDAAQRAVIATQNQTVREALRQSEQQLGAEGRLILRPSGTEPLVRIWGEASDGARLEALITKLTNVVRAQLVEGAE